MIRCNVPNRWDRLTALRWYAGGWLVVSLLVGCDLPERPVLTPQTRMPSDADHELLLAEAEAVARSMEFPEVEGESKLQTYETWHAYFIDDRRVGSRHVSVEHDPSASPALVRSTIDDDWIVTQGRCMIHQGLVCESIENEAGQLQRFSSKLSVGPWKTVSEGVVNSRELEITTRRSSAETRRSIEWGPSYRGFTAIEQSLRQALPIAGRARTMKMLIPVEHQVASVRLVAEGTEKVPMLDGSFKELTQVTGQMTFDYSGTSEVVLWTDAQGVTQKSYSPRQRLVTYLVDRDALGSEIRDHPSVRFGAAVEVRGTIDRPLDAKRTAFRVRPIASSDQRLAAANSKQSFEWMPGPSQYVRRGTEGSTQVLASVATETKLDGFEAAKPEVTSLDTQVTRLIDFNDPGVRRLSSAASIAGLSEKEMALELTRTVSQLIELSDRPTGLTAASSVALSGVGDATSQAILLAALLRSKKLAARVAVGLAYHDGASSEPMLVYHAWVVAFVDGQWVGLDPTLGRVAPADRLLLMTTDFSDDTTEASLLETLEQIGRMEIEIVRSTY